MMAQAEKFDTGKRHNHFDFHSNYTYGRVEISYALHQNMSTFTALHDILKLKGFLLVIG